MLNKYHHIVDKMADSKTIINLLKEIEIFSEFDNSILKKFSENMIEVFISKGETLFNKGDKESAMYIILDGSVEIHVNDYIFTTLNSKQFFGEYSLIDSAVRSASVTAVRDTHLLELQQKTFDEVTAKQPELWKSVLIPLIKRLRDYNIVEEKLTMRTIDIQKQKYKIEQEKESIENQKKELEAINTTKDKFFTIMGNDLKNPFTTITGITDLLLKKYNTIEPEETLEYISQINQHSKNAYSLVDNLLLWARSQTGSIKISFKRTNLKSIIDSIVKPFLVNANQKSITITIDIESELHGYFDIDMISIVIRNIISNALKFTNTNGQINIRAIEMGDMIQVEIEDTGIGISNEDQKNIFSIDKKTNIANSSEKEKTGLGMVLIKEFIQKNGGNIWLDSEPNAGTVVKFTLQKAL